MAVLNDATPLLAVNAVVFDTETTGLDVREARIVQFGAIGITRGRIEPGDSFDRLVDPGMPIPPRSTDVHGIDDTMVKGAPRFAEAWKAFTVFAGKRLLVGFSVGFDLAVIQREAERAGVPYVQPRALCVRMLAQVALPHLHDPALELLAEHLGVGVLDRHTAMGDARITAEVFRKLVPHLTARNVRTVAEAERVCAGLAPTVERHQAAGWAEPYDDKSAKRESLPALGSVDPFAFRHTVGEAMARDPVVAKSVISLARAVAIMTERRISSLFVSKTGEGGDLVSAYGILTERDVMRQIAAHGAAALEMSCAVCATRPIISVAQSDLAYRAIGIMNRHRIRHLAVSAKDGTLAGVVSARDFLKLRSSPALDLHNRISTAPSSVEMADAWSTLPAVAAAMLADDIDARLTTRIISDEMGAMTARAAELAAADMAAAGLGPAPCAHAVILLGSGGRGESLLAADQDNGIIFERGDPDGPEDRWFAELGRRMSEHLHAAAIPLCKGGVMARNPQWRGSLGAWKDRVMHWVLRASPADILNVDIFFDLQPVHGEAVLAHELRAFAYREAGSDLALAKLLAEAGAQVPAATTLFGALRTENGRIDLKRHGLFPLVAGARALAIRHGITAQSTKDRLTELGARDGGPRPQFGLLAEAHLLLLTLILRQQIRDIAAGIPASNGIDPKELDARTLARLKKALASVQTMPDFVRTEMF
jgi:DNA polymerase-3 subunit epsilon/CBS domain-containing protein